MDEETIRLEVCMLMWGRGYTWYHPPDMAPLFNREQAKGKPKEETEEQKVSKKKRDVGRIDLIFPNPIGPCVLMETKLIRMEEKPRIGYNGSLAFSDIRDAQRKTLDRWAYGMDGHAYLAVGSNHNKQRQLWVIPWQNWVAIECQVFEQGFKALPVYSSKGISFTDYFGGFECKWLGSKPEIHWELPERHELLELKTWAHKEDEWNQVSLRFGKT